MIRDWRWAAGLLWALAAAPLAAADPLAAAARQDGWTVHAVPLANGASAPCCFTDWQSGRIGRRACRLDGKGGRGLFGTVDRADLRSRATTLLVHLRFAGGALREVLAVGDDCPVETGGRTLRPLVGVTPGASAAFLLAAARGDDELVDDALQALTLHDRVGTDALLAIARDASQPRAARRQAFFWLGQSEDPRAYAELEALLLR